MSSLQDFPKHLQPPCLSNNNNNNNNNDNNSNINNNDNNNDCESSLLSHYNYKLGGCHGGSKSSSRSMRLSNGKKDIFTYNENGDRVKAFSCQYDGCTKVGDEGRGMGGGDYEKDGWVEGS